MSLVLAIVVLAVATGYVAGGRLRRFEGLEVHWWILVFLALALQAAPLPENSLSTPRLTGTFALLASYGLLLLFVLVNRWIPGARLMAIGLLLNLLVVGLNAGMPVSPSAVETAGGSINEVAEADSPKHHLMDDRDMLGFLGDVVPLPALGIVISVGDVLLYGGVFWFVVQVMRGRSRENPRPLAMWFLSYRGKHAPSYWRMKARYRAPGHAGAGRPGTEP
jgi:Family of unknown function (DUF5317)